MDRNDELLKKFGDFSLTELRNKSQTVSCTLGRLKAISNELNMDFDKYPNMKPYLMKCDHLVYNGKYEPWTIQSHAKNIKQFYKWLRKKKNESWEETEHPQDVRWIKANVKRNDLKIYDKLTEGEISKLYFVATNNRDKALITLLWSGRRASELLNLKICDIDLNKELATMRYKGKTKTSQGYFFPEETIYIKEWLLEHPRRNDPNAFFICVREGKNKTKAENFKSDVGSKLGKTSLRDIVKRLTKKAGITKIITPQTFRRSKAQFLADKGWSAHELQSYFDWDKIDTAESYIQASKQALQNRIKDESGMTKPKEKESKIVKCQRCGVESHKREPRCLKCGFILDMEFANKEIAKKMKITEEEKEEKQILLERLQLVEEKLNLTEIQPSLEKEEKKAKDMIEGLMAISNKATVKKLLLDINKRLERIENNAK